MEEYMKILLEQIRCKKAKEFIAEEIRGHIEDQIDENISVGMTRKEAVQEAIKDMGDPVEAGVSLDRIHRPQIAWSTVIIMGIISLTSILLQVMLMKGNPDLGIGSIIKHVLRIGMGFIMMLVVYRIDYSILGKYGKQIAGIFSILLILSTFCFGIMVNGSTRFLYLGFLSISLGSILYLFVPIYGALLYQYRGSSYKGILKSILWMAFPVCFALQMPNVILAVSLFFMMALLLSIAVYKNWFLIKKRRFLISFWSVILLFPIAFTVIGLKFNLFAVYQSERLRTIFGQSTDSGYSYITTTLKECINNSKIIGFSGDEIKNIFPMYTSDFILASITSYYGFLATAIIIALMAILIGKIFRISFHQKNQLGMIVGYACGIVFTTVTIFNIIVSFGLIPSSYTFLPFFSSGGTGNIVFYIMIGLVLSIYRYKSILPNKTINKYNLKSIN